MMAADREAFVRESVAGLPEGERGLSGIQDAAGRLWDAIKADQARQAQAKQTDGLGGLGGWVKWKHEDDPAAADRRKFNSDYLRALARTDAGAAKALTIWGRMRTSDWRSMLLPERERDLALLEIENRTRHDSLEPPWDIVALSGKLNEIAKLWYEGEEPEALKALDVATAADWVIDDATSALTVQLKNHPRAYGVGKEMQGQVIQIKGS